MLRLEKKLKTPKLEAAFERGMAGVEKRKQGYEEVIEELKCLSQSSRKALHFTKFIII